jgi:hypothetical protein
LSRLLAFQSGIGLVADIAGGGGALALEEARKDGVEERAEDNLGAIGHGKGHPQDQDKLEDVVEREPVDSIDDALKDGEEGVDHPVCQPLSVVNLVTAKQRLKRVVSREDEAGKVDEKFAPNVEEDEKEVETDESEEDVDLGDVGLFLEVIEDRILAKLLIDLRDLVLGFVLERHLDGGQLDIFEGIKVVIAVQGRLNADGILWS